MSKFKIFLIYAFLFTLSNLSYCQAIDYGNNKLAGKYYDVNGIKMYCEIYGKGKPLLLLHGNAGSINAFQKIIPYLSQKYKVMAVDSRAQGKSIDLKDSLSFEMMADDFNVLLNHLKLDSVYVFGWSDGGINALLLAMRHPEKVKKLAATGANIFVDNTAFIPGVFDDMSKENNNFKNINLTTALEKNNRKLFLLDFFQPKLVFKDLSIIKCPSLIISADRDLISFEHTLNIYRNIPNANLWIVPDSNHCTFESNTKSYCDNLILFFNSKK